VYTCANFLFIYASIASLVDLLCEICIKVLSFVPSYDIRLSFLGNSQIASVLLARSEFTPTVALATPHSWEVIVKPDKFTLAS